MSDCDPEFSENRQSKQEEIQIEYTVKGALSKYTTFAGFVIAQRYAGEKIEPGARVVKASWKPKEELILGTICSVEKSISVDVEWDNTAGVHTFPRQQLRLVDNIKPEKIELLSRVITKSEEKKTGTIRGLQKSKRVHIRWDNTQNVHTWPIFELRLFDNAQAGVKHTAVTCDECYDYPLRGIRWKCLSCDEYDLCTKCYMNDKHDVRHAFRRVETEDSKG